MINIEISRGNYSFSIPLQEKTISVGRSPQCDIRLPDEKISRTHLTIENKSDKIILIDKSTHGTALNGEPVQKAEIHVGDLIEISDWKIQLSVNNQNEEKTFAKKFHESTGVFSYNKKNHALILTEARLNQISPIKRTFKITKNFFTIGKSSTNDIVVHDEFVSSYHCKIEFHNSVFIIKDLQSTNGTLLNQQKILGAVLQDESILEIGKAKFTFCHQQKNKKIRPILNQDHFCGMISDHSSMRKIFSLIQSLESSSSPVLIQGETGTGKELIAKAVHENSPRKSKPFISVNCGAIPRELIESELFGHEKGAFTGAVSSREGLFELANGGTLFLDEIGELPIDLQPRLLRVLESGEIRRVGSSKNIHVNVRIVAATHKNLTEEIENQRFREDLYYRIYVIPMYLPALRERKKDIKKLALHFLKNEKKIHPEALIKLQEHRWPGNIRELKNVIERASHLSQASSDIMPEHISFARSQAKNITTSQPVTLDEMEMFAIKGALEKYNWKRRDVAKNLGIAKSTLHEKIRKYGLRNNEDSF